MGFSTTHVPRKGFHSRFLYGQKLAVASGGTMLVLNYNNFDIQESARPMTPAGHTVLTTTSLVIPASGSSAPIVETWWMSPAGGAALLTFHLHGVYYLMSGATSLSRGQMDTMAESLSGI